MASSLKGMELHIRSFKPFIQNAPPYRAFGPQPTQKPPPPTPSKRASPKENFQSSALNPLPVLRGGGSTGPSWTADWDKDVEDEPSGDAAQDYCLLLPEPSPDESNIADGSRKDGPHTPAELKLPVCRPSKWPLPSPDVTTLKEEKKKEEPLPAKKKSIKKTAGGPKSIIRSDSQSRTSAPAKPNHPTDAATTPKRGEAKISEAFRPFGMLHVRKRSSQRRHCDDSPEKLRTDRLSLRGKKLRALIKGSPLVEDSWEDVEMDDTTRQLSFKQDYHDLLQDQYFEMNVLAQEVLTTGGAHQVYEAQFEDRVRGSKVRDKNDGHRIHARPTLWRSHSDQVHTMSPKTHVCSSARSQSREGRTTSRRTSDATSKSPHKHFATGKLHNLSDFMHTSRRSSPDKPLSLSHHTPSPSSEQQQGLHTLEHRMEFVPNSTSPNKSPNTSPQRSNTSSPIKSNTSLHNTTTPPSASSSPSPPNIPSPHPSTLTQTLPPLLHPSSAAPNTQYNHHSAPVSPWGPHCKYSPRSERQPSFNSSYWDYFPSCPMPPSHPSQLRPSPSPAIYANSASASFSTIHSPLTSILPSSNRTSSPSSSRNETFSQPGTSPEKKMGFFEKAKHARLRHRKDQGQGKLKKSIKLLGPTDSGAISE